ncbi:splicing regulatory glutamine/lysine-rich-like protein [Perilla frutescens var. hirtella]|nr:splicing regulatory glutamine/lysine-rich-like protein [Perilla frutescens var. frutescens]KAH6787868.1 splicing regulatory glutamine/lysine-rich-like protein [Perilla frutescens var. hirtella]
MGKSKEDHKLKRSSPSPRYEDESRRKRHRSKDDDKEHKSSKKHKSHKEKKSSSKRKHKGQKHDKVAILNFQELSEDDYFSKNNEFATWLKQEKRKFFADLSSDAARSLFSEFVTAWNDQELEPQYYNGIATAPRTSHKWNIKK